MGADATADAIVIEAEMYSDRVEGEMWGYFASDASWVANDIVVAGVAAAAEADRIRVNPPFRASATVFVHLH